MQVPVPVPVQVSVQVPVSVQGRVTDCRSVRVRGRVCVGTSPAVLRHHSVAGVYRRCRHDKLQGRKGWGWGYAAGIPQVA